MSNIATVRHSATMGVVSHYDVAPVFEAILDSASRLFGSPISVVFRYDGKLVHLEATRHWSAEALEAARAIYPAPPNPSVMSGRVRYGSRSLGGMLGMARASSDETRVEGESCTASRVSANCGLPCTMSSETTSPG